MGEYTRWFSVKDDGPPVQSGLYDWKVCGVSRGIAHVLVLRAACLLDNGLVIIGDRAIDISVDDHWRGIIRPCPRCKTPMEYRKNGALAQTATGSPDELGGDVVTMSAGGPGKLIDCAKCPKCGHSET